MSAKSPAVIGKSPFDRALVELFSSNLSAEQVSASPPINGTLTPVQCLARLQKLLRSKDVLDASDKTALLLEDIYFLRGKLRSQMEQAQYVDKDMAGAWLKTIEAAVKRVETVNVGMNDAMMRFNQLRANEFIESLKFIIGRLLELMEKDHPEIDKAEIYTVMLEAIPDAIPAVHG